MSDLGVVSEVAAGYRLLEVLAEGPLLRVCRARRRADDQTVLLKQPRPGGSPAATEGLLQQEYQLLSRLSAPNVVRALGLERAAGLPLLVLEDCGGVALRRLAAEAPLPVFEVLEVALQVVDGLAAVHAAQLIHKAVSPDHIVYNRASGVAQLIGFGNASALTREHASLAAPAIRPQDLPYVAPEQTGRMNRAIDYRSDYYGLGATLYELLTGCPLFAVSEPIEWFHCHIARQPRSPSELAPEVPAALSAVVMKLLAKTAEERYQSAAGIRADLEQCLGQLRRSGRVEPFPLGGADVLEGFRLPQRLYGRGAERQQLLDSFARVCAGAQELVVVAGRSGIGKTSLLRELYRPVTERRGYFVAGKFEQLNRNVPYSALTSALRELVRQLLTEPETRLEAWRQRLRAALGPNGRLVVEVVPELALVLGPQPPVPTLPPQQAEQLFNRVFLNFIRVFSSQRHPLVVFLDDLQWADAASLRLLELLLSEGQCRSLLLLGAYRDNEVGPAHPLMRALARLRGGGAAVSELRPAPLSLEQLAELLAEGLQTTPAEALPLARLVEQKTAGNPFFSEQFLGFLYEQGLIWRDVESGRWQWQLEAIARQQITDNVVDLMTVKLRRLGADAQGLLQLAACIGNRVPLELLALVAEQPPAAVVAQLREALQEGLLIAADDAESLLQQGGRRRVELAFAHDRIRQAAYGLLPEASRCRTHLEIGRLLLGSLSPAQREQQLFIITNHLNVGRGLIEAAAERRRLCRFNLAAGRRAKASAAYLPAAEYLRIALELLPADAWQDDYRLALEVHAEAAEAAYLGADYAAMDALLEAALARARDLLDTVALCEIRLGARLARGELLEALELARGLLGQLGLRIPRRATRGHVALALLNTRLRLRGRGAEALRHLPLSSDRRQEHLQRVGIRCGSAAYLAQPELFPLLVLHAINHILRYGHSPSAVPAIVSYGIILCVGFDDIEGGSEFGRLGLELGERLGGERVRARVLHLYNAFIRHWQEPLRETLQPLLETHQAGLDTGDFEFAAHASNLYAYYAFFSGMELGRFAEEMVVRRAAVAELRQGGLIHYTEAFHQAALNLQGSAPEPTRLVGASYDEERLLPQHRAAADRGMCLCSYLLKLQLCYLFQRHSEALAHAEAAREYLDAALGSFAVVVANFYESLSRLACCDGATAAERRRHLRRVRCNQRRLAKWARHNPGNCLHKYQLVEAEYLRVGGDPCRAQAYYEQALTGADRGGFIQEAALAAELAATAQREAGNVTVADAYLGKALAAYQAWGAGAKVAQLLAAHPQLEGAGATALPAAAVDLGSLMKALKSIAQETVHSRMVATIIETAIEFAGAQRGSLILRGKAGYCVEAQGSVDAAAANILQSLPVAQSDQLCQPVVNYVMRTGAGLVVHDARQAHPELPGLQLDPYLRGEGVRSILCLPIKTGVEGEEEAVGMLYLENNRASNSFTEARFDTLELICLAAAGRLELSRRAAVDGLTQLYNHDYFQNLLRQEVAASRRHGRELALILADIDHFKQVNDGHGHQAGDRVLQEVAACVRSSCREADVVARYGGEELAVILPETAAATAAEVAERIRRAVAALEVIHEGQRLKVTLSLGVAALRTAMTGGEGLVAAADAALYRAKRGGRDRVVVA